MIFKLRYNILVILQIIINTLNLLLLFTHYGTSRESDIFLLSFSLLSIINLIQLLFAEQFIYYYNKLKISSTSEANYLFSNILIYSFLISLVITLIVYIFNIFFISIIASGYTSTTILPVSNFFSILCISVFFYLPSYLMQNVLNANEQIGTSYLLSILPQFLVCLGFLYIYFIDNNLSNIAIFYNIGILLTFIINLYILRAYINPIAFKKHPLLVELLLNSFKIRLAHNIYGILSLIIINNFLSTFPSGYLSSFHYAKKASDTILNVIYGPTHKLLINIISKGLIKSNIHNIQNILKKINIFVPMVLIPLTIIVFILTPYVLDNFHPMELEKLNLLKYTFLILMMQVLLLSLEVPFAVVNLSKNDSSIFYISNIIFIFCLGIFILLFKSLLDFYTLSLGLFFSQLVNYFLIRIKAKNYLNELITGRYQNDSI